MPHRCGFVNQRKTTGPFNRDCGWSTTLQPVNHNQMIRVPGSRTRWPRERFVFHDDTGRGAHRGSRRPRNRVIRQELVAAPSHPGGCCEHLENPPKRENAAPACPRPRFPRTNTPSFTGNSMTAHLPHACRRQVSVFDSSSALSTIEALRRRRDHSPSASRMTHAALCAPFRCLRLRPPHARSSRS